jgi:peptide/nickel transport system permease protein
MAVVQQAVPQEQPGVLGTGQQRIRGGARYLIGNKKLFGGILLILPLIFMTLIGPLLVDVDTAAPLSTMPDLAPSSEHWFGTDSQGRDLFAVMTQAIPGTLQIGLLAGAIGLGLGIVLGFVSGFVGGWIYTVIRSVADTLISVPNLLVLVFIEATVCRQGSAISITTIALVVASVAWMWPTRTIRSQVLSLRERPYVQMARLNGMSTPAIIFQELVPNLLPFLGASLVGAVSSAILASIGLEALGLGPQSEPTLGMTIYWATYYSSLLRGLWWWWAAPMAAIVLLFMGLFMMTAGLDELSNPRLRRKVE